MNAIEMQNITMAFGKFKALEDVNFVVKKGDIHALIGENGAGKSTLMSILFGLYKPTTGKIMVNGKVVEITSPLKANELGIGMVHQHFKLVENFTVLENILLNNEKTNFGLISYKEDRKKIEKIMEVYGFEVNLNKRIKDCTVAEQQRVEIIKMLYRDADILIFDEPTAILSPKQIDHFLEALKDLQAKGKTIIIISHKLNELKKVANKGTVIRKGKYIGDVDIVKVTPAEIAQMMVGSKVLDVDEKIASKKSDKTVLKIENLSMNKIGHKDVIGLKDFNLEVKEGEIVAIAGVEGNGQQEIVNAITGMQKVHTLNLGSACLLKQIIKKNIIPSIFKKHKSKKESIKEIYNDYYRTFLKPTFTYMWLSLSKSGILFKEIYQKNIVPTFVKSKRSSKESISLIKQDFKEEYVIKALSSGEIQNKISILDLSSQKIRNVSNYSIRKRYKTGLVHIPEDRHKHGLVLDFTLEENAILDEHYNRPYSKYGVISFKERNQLTNKIISDFDVRSGQGSKSISRTLSGGNQQKFIVGRELERKTSLIVIVQPTRGLDVGAIKRIHEFILKAKKSGKSILLVSYELDEILLLSDKIVVVNSGAKVAEVETKNITKEKLGEYMASGKGGARESK